MKYNKIWKVTKDEMQQNLQVTKDEKMKCHTKNVRSETLKCHKGWNITKYETSQKIYIYIYIFFLIINMILDYKKGERK